MVAAGAQILDMAMADPDTIRSRVLRDTVELSLSHGCTFNCAARVFAQLRQSGIAIHMGNGAPAAVASFALPHAFSASRQAIFAKLPPEPYSFPSSHVKLCTYRKWFSRPMGCKSASYWGSPMGTAKLQWLLRFRMGSHRLPIEPGCRLRLPRVRQVCRLCGTGQLGDERH